MSPHSMRLPPLGASGRASRHPRTPLQAPAVALTGVCSPEGRPGVHTPVSASVCARAARAPATPRVTGSKTSVDAAHAVQALDAVDATAHVDETLTLICRASSHAHQRVPGPTSSSEDPLRPYRRKEIRVLPDELRRSSPSERGSPSERVPAPPNGRVRCASSGRRVHAGAGSEPASAQRGAQCLSEVAVQPWRPLRALSSQRPARPPAQ